MKKILISITAVAVVGTSLFAAGTAACKGCHGQNFEKRAMNVSKVVKDMSRSDIVSALKGYKDGTYGRNMKGIMSGQVKTLDEAAIEAIATEIAGEEKKKMASTTSMTDVVDAATNKAKEAATGAAAKMMK